MGMIDPVGVPDSPRTDGQKYLISTPAGGKYIISRKVFGGIMYGTNPELVWTPIGVPNLKAIFAKKIGDTEERFHHLPIAVSDISPYSEPAPETEPVGGAMMAKPPERPTDHFPDNLGLCDVSED